MDALRALGPLSGGARAEVEDGELRVFLSLDMLHLEADALHDRLAHWTLTELARVLPASQAHVSFRHASPAEPDEAATLDLQERWLGLEPMFVLDLTRASAADIERFALLMPRFLELVKKEGRPEGFRSPDVGSME